MMDQGFANVFALKGGWRQWLGNEFPTEKK
jgi:rhodanese-related sulfurtransferase